VIISAFGPAGPAQCSGLPIVRYEAGALAAQLGTGFGLLDSSLAIHRTPAGAQQQFIYCRFERRAS
jgi:hypothetical protein